MFPIEPYNRFWKMFTVGSAVLLYGGTALAESGAATGLSHLETDAVILTLLSFSILFLSGVLLRMRQLRIQLEQKSKALNKSEQHIQLMGDHLPNVTIFQLMFTEEEEFRFTHMSKGYEKTLGFKRQQVLKDADLAYDHVYEEDLPLLKEAFESSRKALIPVDLELRVLDQSGQLKWLHVSAVPHRDQENLVWDGFMLDISQTKDVEDALVEENRNFQNLFETIDDFLMVCDMDGRLLHSNPSVINRLSYTRTELREMSIYELYPEQHRKEIYEVIARLQTEQTTTCGCPLQTRNKELIPVEMNVFQGTWKNKTALFGVARDIGRRQQTESALRESQRMLQLIMDTIPMAVFWKDKDSVYLGCNKTFIHECGFNSIDDVVGKTPFDLFEPNFAPDVVERDQEVIANNQPFFNFLQQHTRHDGTIGWREISKIPLRNEEGRAVGVLGVWRDVTEQSHAEERLKRTLEDMERFNQLMRGRERRTLELKAEINALLKQLGQPRKYRTTTDDLG